MSKRSANHTILLDGVAAGGGDFLAGVFGEVREVNGHVDGAEDPGFDFALGRYCCRTWRNGLGLKERRRSVSQSARACNFTISERLT